MTRKSKALKIAILASSAGIVPLVPTGIAHADQLSSAKAQAAAISSKITSLNNQIAQLSEQYDQAQTQLSTIQSQVANTKGLISRDRAHISSIRKKMAKEAITAFTQAGTSSSVISLLQGSATDVSVSQEYMNSVSTSQQDLVLSLQNAQMQLQTAESRLNVEQSQASTTLSQLGQLRSQAQANVTYEQNALNSQNTQIANLVRQAQQAALQAQQARAAQAAVQAASRPAPPPVPAPPPMTGSVISTVLATAYAQLGKPYQFGAAGPNAFDCSGLVMYSYASAGISLTHNAAAQYDETSRISQSQLQPGDLVFYAPGGNGIDHDAIYVGGGRVLEADTYGIPVEIDSMYFVGNPVGYGRVQ
ncbi:MAG: NlpC/P60 family protein [Acidimicrobiales bacterium]